MSPEPKPPEPPSILRAEGCAAGRGWRGCARCAGGGSRARASTPAAAPPRAPAPAPAPAIPAAPPRALGATSGSKAPMAPAREVTPRHVMAAPRPSLTSGAVPRRSRRGSREGGAQGVRAGRALRPGWSLAPRSAARAWVGLRWLGRSPEVPVSGGAELAVLEAGRPQYVLRRC